MQGLRWENLNFKNWKSSCSNRFKRIINEQQMPVSYEEIFIYLFIPFSLLILVYEQLMKDTEPSVVCYYSILN